MSTSLCKAVASKIRGTNNRVMRNRKIYSRLNGIDSFCGVANSSDSCKGDSGGPLHCLMDGKWVVYGITSHGPTNGRYAVCNTRLPAIYGKVSAITSWINSGKSSFEFSGKNVHSCKNDHYCRSYSNSRKKWIYFLFFFIFICPCNYANQISSEMVNVKP